VQFTAVVTGKGGPTETVNLCSQTFNRAVALSAQPQFCCCSLAVTCSLTFNSTESIVLIVVFSAWRWRTD